MHSGLNPIFEKGRILLALGVYDALSARIVRQAGIPSVYVTGYGAAAARLGAPDIGLMTMSEMVSHIKNIADNVDCPVIADGDTGYGGPTNVWRTVREYEAAGVHVIQLEDQEWPKRCGHMEGKRLVEPEEMLRRIKAALKARSSSDFKILARTDAIAVEGFDKAIDRARMYQDAGADILFVEAPRNEEEMARIPELLDAPLLANMVEGGKTPFCSVSRLRELGYSIALYPISTMYAAARTLQRVAKVIMTEESTRSISGDMLTFDEFNELIGLKDYQSLLEL